VATLVLTLARETGWTEEHILWKVPLTRALQYYHGALWYNGAHTVAPLEDARKVFDRVAQLLSKDEDLCDE